VAANVNMPPHFPHHHRCHANIGVSITTVSDHYVRQGEGAVMTEYLIYFNQQWVGDHTEEWFRGRGPLARAVVAEMKDAGVYVFAGGLEEDGPVYSADTTSGTLTITDGPYVEPKEFLGGFALVDVADDEAAKMWAGKVAEACGWPHEVRRFKPQSQAE
jgi:hypothetical protein